MARVTMKELLEAGVHFGHPTRRWNPKMKPYIYGERNGIYIIDLHQTLRGVEAACDFVSQTVSEGHHILFVGTKKQAQEGIVEAAERCGMYYVIHRWLGGMLTNWPTIRQRIGRLRELQGWAEDGTLEVLPKKEAARLREEMAKLERVFCGLQEMPGLPSAVFVVDLKEEHIAVKEAHKLDIPVIAIVDTNCDPDEADYVIPGNDDAIRAIRLIAGKIAEAVLEGRGGAEKLLAEEGQETARPEEAPATPEEEAPEEQRPRRKRGRRRKEQTEEEVPPTVEEAVQAAAEAAPAPREEEHPTPVEEAPDRGGEEEGAVVEGGVEGPEVSVADLEGGPVELAEPDFEEEPAVAEELDTEMAADLLAADLEDEPANVTD